VNFEASKELNKNKTNILLKEKIDGTVKTKGNSRIDKKPHNINRIAIPIIPFNERQQ
tara:strand:- start:38 stop:208 length:171 start_codon:yes stop_codon:yes gene_type:complete